jgi:hypothetical protein
MASSLTLRMAVQPPMASAMREEEDQRAVLRGGVDEHGWAPWADDGATGATAGCELAPDPGGDEGADVETSGDAAKEACRRLSESSTKPPRLTTTSPAARPSSTGTRPPCSGPTRTLRGESCSPVAT